MEEEKAFETGLKLKTKSGVESKWEEEGASNEKPGNHMPWTRSDLELIGDDVFFRIIRKEKGVNQSVYQ